MPELPSFPLGHVALTILALAPQGGPKAGLGTGSWLQFWPFNMGSRGMKGPLKSPCSWQLSLPLPMRAVTTEP